MRLTYRRASAEDRAVTTHTAHIHWQREGHRFTDNQYSRAHQWRFDGGAVVQASSSPSIVPVPMSNAANVDPEEAFVAALSSCHMLWFLNVAREAGHVVDRYEDAAEGVLSKLPDGRRSLTAVTLKPKVRFEGAPVSVEALNALHHQAHQQCFLASAVRCDMKVEPVVS